jgi:hypothetical protein
VRVEVAMAGSVMLGGWPEKYTASWVHNPQRYVGLSMAETAIKHAEPTAVPRKTMGYAFASKHNPGPWCCPLVRSLIERDRVKAVARAIAVIIVGPKGAATGWPHGKSSTMPWSRQAASRYLLPIWPEG